MNPETAKARLVNRHVFSPREVLSQVMDQFIGLRRLAKAFMLPLLRTHIDLPVLFVNIQAQVNRLTSKIKFGTLNHGKPPFGEILSGNKIISERMRLALFFCRIEYNGLTTQFSTGYKAERC